MPLRGLPGPPPMKKRMGLAQLSDLAVTHCSMPPMTTKPESSTLVGLPLHEGERLTCCVGLRAGASAEIESDPPAMAASPRARAIDLVMDVSPLMAKAI